MAREAAEGKVVLVTGASSGIGRACADLLARSGFTVHGTSRSAPVDPPAGWTWQEMDVRDGAAVGDGVARIVAAAGRLDAVVNNAGFGIAGAVEDTTVGEALDLFQTNFLGALRVCRAVLPHFRARGTGTIVNVSSLGGRIGLPFQGLYSASKYALEGMTEALRMEVKPFGVKVVLVEPGDTRTGFTAHRQRTALSETNGAYRERFIRALQRIEEDETGGGSPEVVARLILRVLRHPSPRLRYTVGNPVQRLAAVARGVLPGRLFEWGIMRYYGVH
ncbi:SDR family oxidoreductase [Candidatus Bipolaricaulota bacterium]|nr:SDR family oxidoreductase [Candidatus Bipolaricaulota bacterium]